MDGCVRSGARPARRMRPLLRAALASLALIAAALPAAAQDATWLQNPGSGDFNTAAADGASSRAPSAPAICLLRRNEP